MDISLIERAWGIKLRPSGERFVMSCPFHRDEHPSLVIYPETSSYHCFGCSSDGSLVDLVLRANNPLVTMKEAQTLARPAVRRKHATSFAEVPFDLLESKLEPVANPLLYRHQIRFAVCGKYAGRYVIPYLFGGRIVAFELRDFSSRMYPKVICQPFRAPVKQVLWDIDSADTDYVVLVEGVKDALCVKAFGVESVVSSGGASLTVAQASLLVDRTSRVYVAYDANVEGQLGAWNAIAKLLGSLEVYYVALPVGKDPADCTQKEFIAALEAAESIQEPRVVALQSFVHRTRRAYSTKGGILCPRLGA